MSDDTQFHDAEQQRAVAIIQSLDVTAPPALRATVQDQIQAASTRQRQRVRFGRRIHLGLLAPAAAAVAAVIIAVVLITGGAGPSAPTLHQTAALALSVPTAGAPAERGSRLDVSAAGISFPYWRRTVGWRAVGARADTIAGRRIVTVFYAAAPYVRVGYAIVSGAPLAVPGGSWVVRHGVRYTVITQGSSRLVTWQQDGHTCVIAGRGTSPATLLRLATAPVAQ